MPEYGFLKNSSGAAAPPPPPTPWAVRLPSIKAPGSAMTRKTVQTPFRVNHDPEISQINKYWGRLTQLWVIFRVKLTDFRVIVDPEWSLAPNGPFSGRVTLTRVFLECMAVGSICTGIFSNFSLTETIVKNSKQILTAQSDGGGNYHSQGAVHTGPSITPGEGGGG